MRESIPLIERANLEKLKDYTILGTSSSKIIDDLMAFTASLFNTQIAVVNFVDNHNIWAKTTQPLEKIDLPLETNVCSLAVINECADVLEELSLTPGLITNALIAAELGMRFFASAPIMTDGVQIGSVCLIDKTKREFLPQDQEKLEWVVGLVKKEMDKKVAKRICA